MSSNRGSQHSEKEFKRTLDVAARQLQHGLALRPLKAHQHQALHRGVRRIRTLYCTRRISVGAGMRDLRLIPITA